jgi:plastocyanin
VGDTVTWSFKDASAAHNVDGKGSDPDFYSGNPVTKGTWSHTFAQTGTFSYRCDVHPSMTGKVVVNP